FKYLEFKIQDVNSKNIDLWEQAKINHFRWESFSRFEPSIVQNYLDSNRIDSSKIEQQWLHWRNGLGLSDDIDSVQVYAVEIYLEPEKQEDTIYKQYIYTIESRPYNEQ
ncbi:MAG: sRNA-binding regulator protein Hfq, partial [Bacteroidia bacterium]